MWRARSIHRFASGCLAAWLLAADVASGSSLHLAKLCRNFACHQADRPMMDYDEESSQCVCREHPCWDDNGQTHHCKDPAFPFLGFYYTTKKELVCTCASIPRYDSEYIARDLCPGHRCEEPAHPILDWDEAASECVCRSHPCWNDKGERHECRQEQFPILRYREEEDDLDQVRPVCECFMKLVKEDHATGDSELSGTGADWDNEFAAPDDYYNSDEF